MVGSTMGPPIIVGEGNGSELHQKLLLYNIIYKVINIFHKTQKHVGMAVKVHIQDHPHYRMPTVPYVTIPIQVATVDISGLQLRI